MTDNTVIDALLQVVHKIENDNALQEQLKKHYDFFDENKNVIVITGHRRENFGEKFEGISAAIAKAANKNPDAQFVYPVHLNPRVQEPVNRLQNGKANVFLIEPLEYLPFVNLMRLSTVILTDSGAYKKKRQV